MIFNVVTLWFDYSELSNKHGVFLILFEKIFPATSLIRTSTFINFWGILPPPRLLEPPRLFILGESPNYKLFWAILSAYFVVLITLKWPASLKLSLNSQIIAVLSFQVAQISFKHNWSLLIKKKNSTFIQFWKFFPTTRFLRPPRLFDNGHFSYLQIIRFPRLLESSEYWALLIPIVID